MPSVSGLLTSLIVAGVWSKTDSLPNVNCSPIATVVKTSRSDSYHYYPYFVTLHQCAGSKGRTEPRYIKCVPDQIEMIDVEMLLTASMSSKSKGSKGSEMMKRKITKQMANHTSCKYECKIKREDCKNHFTYDEKKCRCICKLGMIGLQRRKCGDSRKIWSNVFCGCVCSNRVECSNRRQYFDEESCSCRCKRRKGRLAGCVFNGENYDPLTCSCYSSSRQTNRNKGNARKDRSILFWLSAVGIELLVMIMAFETFLYKRNCGMIFVIKTRLSKEHTQVNNRNDDSYDENLEPPKIRLTYKELLRRQSRSIRKRSSRNSSAYQGPRTPLMSPNQDNEGAITEDVFFNE